MNVSTVDSTVGSFLFVFLLSLALGMQLNVIRWLLFERVICRKWRLSSEDFVTLSQDGRLTAFHTARDENFRYHQFYGAMTILVPFLAFGLMREAIVYTSLTFWCYIVAFGFIEFSTGFAAREAYKRYVERSRAILKGGEYAQRSPEQKEEESG